MRKADQIASGLIASGCIELTSNSPRYRKFQRPDKDNTFYWIEGRGTLKVGMVVARLFNVHRRTIERFIRAGMREREKKQIEDEETLKGRLQ